MIANIVVTTESRLNLAPANELEEIGQNVATILKTIKGSVPLDRDLGVNFSPIDAPSNQALMLWKVEIIEAIERDEPRARVLKIEFDKTNPPYKRKIIEKKIKIIHKLLGVKDILLDNIDKEKS